MLDLVFLICLAATLLYALRGAYKETLCSVATVVGILAAVIGFVIMFLRSSSGNVLAAFLRILEFVFAFGLRFIARHFVKLYNDKIEEENRKIRETMSRYTRDDPHVQGPVYNDSNFDDPELRFGKGGYTDKNL